MTLSVLRLPDTSLASLRELDTAPVGQTVEAPSGLRYSVARIPLAAEPPREPLIGWWPGPETVLVAQGHPDNGTRETGVPQTWTYGGEYASGKGPQVDVLECRAPGSWDGFWDKDWFDFITARRGM